MSGHLIIFIGVLSVSATPVTSCPNVSDLRTGVVLEYGNGDYSIVTRDGEGVVREVEHIEDLGESSTYVMANGVLETAYIAPFEEESEYYRYDFPIADIEPLQEWSGGSGRRKTLDPNDNVVEEITFAWQTRGVEKYVIGECAFDAIPLETVYTDDIGTTMSAYRYLIDLKIPVVIGFYYDGSADLYPPLEIRPAE